MNKDQKPIAWMHTSAAGFTYFRRKRQDDVFNPRPLYEQPLTPRWRGITPEDLEDLLGFHCDINGEMNEVDAKKFAADIEKRLKEKNA